MRNKILLSMCIFVWIISSAFVPAAAAQQQDDKAVTVKVTQVDTTQFPKVVAYVSAVDAEGNPVQINPNQLVLRENGKTIRPDVIAGSDDSAPIKTMLVIDVSGSMRSANKLKNAKKVAAEYVNQMRSGDMAGLIAYNTKVTIAQELTDDHTSLLAAIESLKAGDDTAMFDALQKAVDLLSLQTGRKAIIVLTDGLDNRSQTTPLNVLDSIGETGLSISTIGLGNPGQSTGNASALDEKTLTALANNTGGEYGMATDEASLLNIYTKYGRLLQSEYAVTFTSTGALRDGINRQLTVVLQDGGLASWSDTTRTEFNPGGLLPEVAGSGTWPTFFILLVILVALLFLPRYIHLRKPASANANASVPSTPVETPRMSRVKLK
jgi:Ca-activated chloride channel homolog